MINTKTIYYGLLVSMEHTPALIDIDVSSVDLAVTVTKHVINNCSSSSAGSAAASRLEGIHRATRGQT